MSRRLKTVLIVIGAIVGLVCLILVVLTLLGPTIGNVFSNVISYAPPMGAAYPEYAEEAAAEAEGLGARVTRADVTLPTERLIIRNGSISMTVDDTRAVRDTIEQAVDGMASEGAFVVSVSEYGGVEGESPVISMTIRVPATRFDEVMDTLAGMAVQVLSRDESGEDVTEEYVDLAARLESLETARQRLLEIMRGAEITQELLMAEQQLTQREAEIESIHGRMQYLEQSAALSRIDIELQPYILSQPVDTSWRPAETVREAVDALLNNLRGLADALIYFSIAYLPFLILAGAMVYFVVRFVIRRV